MSLLSTPTLYYIGNWFYKIKLTPIAMFFMKINKILNCCDINPKATIGKNLHISHSVGLVIGGSAKIGKNCEIYHNVTVGRNKKHVPIIGDNVKIYPHTIISGNVIIPSNSVIPAKTTIITSNKFVWEGEKSIKKLAKRRIK